VHSERQPSSRVHLCCSELRADITGHVILKQATLGDMYAFVIKFIVDDAFFNVEA
jgi:hypothetical protein